MTKFSEDSSEYQEWSNSVFNSSPRYETIIGQKLIGDIWVYSRQNNTVYFHACVMKSISDPGWLEDGIAVKGEIISSALFDDFKEAFDWLSQETLLHLEQIYGGLTPEALAV